MLCAIAIFLTWILAEPSNVAVYIHWVGLLAGAGVVGFLIYVGLKTTCGRFRRPRVNAENQPTGEEDVIWGGFWKKPLAAKAVRQGESVEDFLKGNLYNKSKAWSGFSLGAAAVTTASVLLVALVCSTAAIATAATAAQVVLTNRPARQVFGTGDVPGLPTPETTSTSNRANQTSKGR